MMNLTSQIASSPDLGHVVALRNGATVQVRPIRPDDAPGLIELCGRLSPQTLYQRFFTVRRLRPEDAAALSRVDGHERMAIVAERDSGQRSELVGVARYALAGEGKTPEIGLVVEDAWQGLGLGSILLNQIMRKGDEEGFSTFHAEILADNGRMRHLLARSADIVEGTIEHGVITVVFRPPLTSLPFDLTHHQEVHGGST